MKEGSIHSKHLGNTTGWYPAYFSVSSFQFFTVTPPTIGAEHLHIAGTTLGTDSTKIKSMAPVFNTHIICRSTVLQFCAMIEKI